MDLSQILPLRPMGAKPTVTEGQDPLPGDFSAVLEEVLPVPTDGAPNADVQMVQLDALLAPLQPEVLTTFLTVPVPLPAQPEAVDLGGRPALQRKTDLPEMDAAPPSAEPAGLIQQKPILAVSDPPFAKAADHSEKTEEGAPSIDLSLGAAAGIVSAAMAEATAPSFVTGQMNTASVQVPAPQIVAGAAALISAKFPAIAQEKGPASMGRPNTKVDLAVSDTPQSVKTAERATQGNRAADPSTQAPDVPNARAGAAPRPEHSPTLPQIPPAMQQASPTLRSTPDQKRADIGGTIPNPLNQVAANQPSLAAPAPGLSDLRGKAGAVQPLPKVLTATMEQRQVSDSDGILRRVSSAAAVLVMEPESNGPPTSAAKPTPAPPPAPATMLAAALSQGVAPVLILPPQADATATPIPRGAHDIADLSGIATSVIRDVPIAERAVTDLSVQPQANLSGRHLPSPTVGPADIALDDLGLMPVLPAAPASYPTSQQAAYDMRMAETLPLAAFVPPSPPAPAMKATMNKASEKTEVDGPAFASEPAPAKGADDDVDRAKDDPIDKTSGLATSYQRPDPTPTADDGQKMSAAGNDQIQPAQGVADGESAGLGVAAAFSDPVQGPGSIAAKEGIQPLRITPEAISQQVVHVVVSHAEDRAELLLQPAELGRLRFEFTHRGDAVQVTIMAERPETMDLLRRNVDQLLGDLRTAGFSGSELSFGAWGQGQGQARPSAMRMEDTASDGAAPQPILPVFQQTPVPRSRAGGLDLRL